jgi:hypothetical protein
MSDVPVKESPAATTEEVAAPDPIANYKPRERVLAVQQAAEEVDQMAANRRAEVSRAEGRHDALVDDRSRIEAAESELAGVDGDPALLGPIDEAQQRLNRTRADTPELIEARRKLLELARQLTAPPPAMETIK